jgi:FdhD protein
MQPQTTARNIQVHRYENGALTRTRDAVAVEEPLEIRIGGRSVAVTMRTPGHDFELAAGFLCTEGIVRDPHDIETITYCVDEAQEYNVLSVDLRPWVKLDLDALTRNFYTTSSCGICGKASIDAVRVRIPEMQPDTLKVPPSLIGSIPAKVKGRQTAFDRTGGVHAAWLCTSDGSLITVREDVGRHNTVDKVIGEQFTAGKLPLRDRLLMLSGRAGFELVQKAAVAGIPIVIAIGAPTSLAIQLAEEAGITLIGFARATTFNVYTHPARIEASQSPDRKGGPRSRMSSSPPKPRALGEASG